MECSKCKEHLWVCESHPDKPWSDIAGGDACCGGAGQPCECTRPIIEPAQVTRWDVNNTELPTPTNEYFWFKTIGENHIQYGFQERTKSGRNQWRTRWVKISEAAP